MKNAEHIFLLIAVLAFAFIFYTRPGGKVAVLQDGADASANVPWYLTYNASAPSLNIQSAVSPQWSAGTNASQQPCSTCSVFGAGYTSAH